MATVVLPALSAQQAADREREYQLTLDWAVRTVLLVGVPASLALMILAQPILTTLFQYGALDSRDVAMASLSLRAYALGLCAFMLIKVLAPGYYARQDMKTPVRIGIRAMLANMLLNIVLVWAMVSYFGVGHVGLALATALSACLNAALLWRGLLRSDSYRFDPCWRRYLLRLGLACVGMSVLLSLLQPDPALWERWLWAERAQRLAVLCVVGVFGYVASLWQLGMRIADLRAPHRVALSSS